MWRSSRCQPRGRTINVAVLSSSSYRLPCSFVKSIRRRIASERLTWPRTMLSQVGEFESSKSAMNTFAPQLSALITILRSVGPVISHRRSWRSAGAGSTLHDDERTSAVSVRNVRSAPASSCAWRSSRCSRSARLEGSNRRCRSAMNASASFDRTASYPDSIRPVIVISLMPVLSVYRQERRKMSDRQTRP